MSNKSTLERQREAIERADAAAYAALVELEDAVADLEDRVERRGTRPSIEGR